MLGVHVAVVVEDRRTQGALERLQGIGGGEELAVKLLYRRS